MGSVSQKRGLLAVRTRPDQEMGSQALPAASSSRPIPDFTRAPGPGRAPAPSCSFLVWDILGSHHGSFPGAPGLAPPHLSSAISKQSIWANTSAISSFSFCGAVGGGGATRRESQGQTSTTTSTPGRDLRPPVSCHCL